MVDERAELRVAGSAYLMVVKTAESKAVKMVDAMEQ